MDKTTLPATDDTAAWLRHVKRSLHGMMNGPVSASMREKGLAYKVIFGVELPRLQNFSHGLPHTASLAAALWKEDIRECRLLAGMVMPPETFGADLAELWTEQMRFTEEAECTVMHLFSRLPEASTLAYAWIASDDRMHALCGYLLLARLFMAGAKPGQRDADEFLDQTHAALLDGDPAVSRAAGKALLKFMDLGAGQEAAGERLLRALETHGDAAENGKH